MKARILSDIHLEFGEREFDFSNCDVVILAGDIHIGSKGIAWLNEHIKNIPVIYVLGNHEYYKHAYPKVLHQIKDLTKNTNIHVLENDSITLDEITFHGATLWTDFNLFNSVELASYSCEQGMNDYKQIRRSPTYSKLRAIDTLSLHKKSISWLSKSLTESETDKNVVITHHAPSIKAILPKYQNDIISAAFASNLEQFILEKNLNLWIHGHVHAAFDYMIGKTRIICNPAGYPMELNTGFNKDLIVEI